MCDIDDDDDWCFRSTCSFPPTVWLAKKTTTTNNVPTTPSLSESIQPHSGYGGKTHHYSRFIYIDIYTYIYMHRYINDYGYNPSWIHQRLSCIQWPVSHHVTLTYVTIPSLSSWLSSDTLLVDCCIRKTSVTTLIISLSDTPKRPLLFICEKVFFFFLFFFFFLLLFCVIKCHTCI